ncbi:hypothetical protein BSNK01_22150 [Bacillaceae bacterium]
MISIVRRIISIFLVFVSVLMFGEGFDLLSLGTDVDGGGIGVHFLGLEINDKVPVESIPKYAIGFLVAGVITMLNAFALMRKSFLS